MDSNNNKPESERQEKPKPTRERPNKKDPMIPFGTVLHEKYRLTEIIGAGGYGQIFKASWDEKKIHVAVKVMTKQHEPQRMILEQNILKQLQNKPNFPYLFGSGNHGDDYMFICMELLGRSLSDLRKKCEGKRFEPSTAIRISIQVLDALKILHEIGYVHRDVKPGNMCCGYGPSTFGTVYLVDFGLSRKFANGEKQLKRRRAGFRGTLRYVSLNVHARKDQGPLDDLTSLFYSAIEMSEGTLPWTKLRDAEEIRQRKEQATAFELCRLQPLSLYDFYWYCSTTTDEKPDYETLSDVLRICLPEDVPDSMSYEAVMLNDTDTRPCSTEERG